MRMRGGIALDARQLWMWLHRLRYRPPFRQFPCRQCRWVDLHLRMPTDDRHDWMISCALANPIVRKCAKTREKRSIVESFFVMSYLLLWILCIKVKLTKHASSFASHSDTRASAEPVAKYLPVGSNSMQMQVPGCAFSMCCSSKSG